MSVIAHKTRKTMPFHEGILKHIRENDAVLVAFIAVIASVGFACGVPSAGIVFVLAYIYCQLNAKLDLVQQKLDSIHLSEKGIRSPIEDTRLLTLKSNQDDDSASSTSSERQIRIFMDGAFDMTHYGHFNALRLGKELGNYLVVGVNSSESVLANKGFAPVLTDEERCIAVEGCRFVDEIVERSPYVMTKEYIEKMIKEKEIDFFAHGSDPCLVDGVDVYDEVRQMGKFMTVPRTRGISTTDIVGRMLLFGRTSTSEAANRTASTPGLSGTSSPNNMSPASSPQLATLKTGGEGIQNLRPLSIDSGENCAVVNSTLPVTSSSDSRRDESKIRRASTDQLDSDVTATPKSSYPRGRPIKSKSTAKSTKASCNGKEVSVGGITKVSNLNRTSRFYSTSALLQSFSKHCRPPQNGQKVVYFPGTWDMFNANHILAMKEAKEQGDYLLIGIYSDELVSELEGANYPVLSFYERTLSVLGCKYTDDILLPAPEVITDKFLEEFEISTVVVMRNEANMPNGLVEKGKRIQSLYGSERFDAARTKDILIELEPPIDLGITTIVDRMLKSHTALKTKFEKKIGTELAY